MRTILAATGTKLPERRIPNSFFNDRRFLNPDGSTMGKPVEEIIEKLEQITGIKERRYISAKGDSVPLMRDAAQAAIDTWGKDKNSIDQIIVAHNAGNMLEGMDGFHPIPNMAALLKNALEISNHERSKVENETRATPPSEERFAKGLLICEKAIRVQPKPPNGKRARISSESKTRTIIKPTRDKCLPEICLEIIATGIR